MSLIVPHVYLSSLKVAADETFLRSHKIKHVLSCDHFSSLKYKPEQGIKRHKMIKMKDNHIEPISEYFHLAFDFLHTAVLAQENVLVHCLKGMSRSATIVTSYLMLAHSMRYSEALALV